MRGEIEHLEGVLAELLAGENPPLSARTGSRTRELPNAVS